MISKGAMRTAASIFTAAILAYCWVAWSAPAKASEIDLSTWTCKQFLSASEQEVALILVWLDGYYRGDEDPVINTAQLANNRTKLEAYCKGHPETTLITAADALFERE
jgi:acid stress chaperone HdeB